MRWKRLLHWMFQSTLPRRERRDTSLHHRPRDTFQSTLPRRERRTAENTISRFDRFNPRSHEGSDISAPSLICIEFVSIHAPTKGATWAAKTRKRSNYCFNPRSHEGSDSCRLQRIYQGGSFNPRSHEGSDCTARNISPSDTVSIHAPTKGATRSFSGTSFSLSCFNPRSHEGSDADTNAAVADTGVSIHAPTKGATLLIKLKGTPVSCFNPRSHEGSDQVIHAVFRLVKDVSIHAPTKGATIPKKSFIPFRTVSIHAPTKGATNVNASGYLILRFQSTLPRRERQSYNRIIQSCKSFNPRSHEGSDGVHVQIRMSVTCFNPRSHEGSDGVIQPLEDNHIYVSIHAPTKGATYCGRYLWQGGHVSIHAPTKGATSGVVGKVLSHSEFQSTLPRRERRN